ncbi:hypothetical protein [Spongiibacter marinus]|uniref:hypothetical protein n=1 Tax=Spongiibacter marinus TaxID=354246 RepID=UPI0019621A94|nr:hypothetical protein [Spongiibacter marinus]MBM7424986.1 hypothetical protein [Spongiibacter marinus]
MKTILIAIAGMISWLALKPQEQARAIKSQPQPDGAPTVLITALSDDYVTVKTLI